MTHNSAHQQLIEWLKHQLSEKQQQLSDAEAQLAELQALSEQIRGDLAFLKERLWAETSTVPLEKADSEPGDLRSNGHLSLPMESENSGEPENSTNHRQEGFEDEDQDMNIEENGNRYPAKRSPKEMMRVEFASMTLGDAAQKIMEVHPHPLTTKQLADAMFEPKSEEEALRAKSSLATELRRGAKEGRWQKRERGLFALNSCLPQ